MQFFRVEFCSLKFDRNDLGNPENLPCRNYRCLKILSNFDCPYGSENQCMCCSNFPYVEMRPFSLYTYLP